MDWYDFTEAHVEGVEKETFVQKKLPLKFNDIESEEKNKDAHKNSGRNHRLGDKKLEDCSR